MIIADKLEDYEQRLPDRVETFRFSDKETDFRFVVNKDLLDGKDRDYFIGALLCMNYLSMTENIMNGKK